ncbi:hypothetical protein FIU87_04960 [Bacillus sp. THAF10]|uniref:DUF4083 domain-containing protein n=1 Tax=Bacillus sp. THAF10 TaxID=2587848 RepID=UPI00126875F7|nr:DUF4083 domain-containing protein [Bacillus sp. THAF10]QFT88000.1 hypothetical protein FIU87_04960 [Bacillus sp. THAF10]
MNLVDTLFQLFVFGLIILFVVSFTFFIRRLLINASVRNQQLKEMNEKLDRLVKQVEKKS